jgi:hypothetical protein
MMDRNRIILDLFSKHETWADGVPGARRLDEAMVHLRLQSQGASNPDGLSAVVADLTALTAAGYVSLVDSERRVGPFQQYALTAKGRTAAAV